MLMVALLAFPQHLFAGKKWEGKIPGYASDPDPWKYLLEVLRRDGFPYGAMAASRRMLAFFVDLPIKEAAYQTVVDLIDAGYPFSTRHLFVTGDIDSNLKSPFMDSYHLYKALTNHQKGMEKWAKYYFGKLDPEKSPKYVFYQALAKYERHDLAGARKILEKLLSDKSAMTQESFAKKVSRTLARIDYEEEQFADAADIYENFLLRLNPVNPGDWLEAAWTFYHLKQYEKVLGLLYNLDSRSSEDGIDLEKYVLRALVYREYCATDAMKLLVASFEKDFGPAIMGIKTGLTLTNFDALKVIFHPRNRRFFEVYSLAKKLESEKKRLRELPDSVRELASYLYVSETEMLERLNDIHEEKAVARSSEHLVMLAENIRFLTFDVAREKYNPDAVFQDDNQQHLELMESLERNRFLIRWDQTGDYWRDERLLYRGKIRNQCSG